MTNREFYEKVIAINPNEELVEYAKNEIAKLDKRNASRSAKPSKTAIANEPIKKAIIEYLKVNKVGIASKIAEDLELSSTSKASALLVQLQKEGKVTSTDTKVKGKGKVKGYSLAVAEEEKGE